MFRIKCGESKHKRVKAAEQRHVSFNNEVLCKCPVSSHEEAIFAQSDNNNNKKLQSAHGRINSLLIFKTG